MDERIWFYIIAAVIWYFIKRKKKSPEDEVPETTSNRPQQQRKQVSFEDLLKEITEQREQETRQGAPAPVARPIQQHVEEEDLPLRKQREEREALEREGRNRHFADAETRRVYEESVKMAEGFDIEFAPDKKFVKENLFKGKSKTAVAEASYGDEIRESLRKPDSVRKAIIYAEILSKRY